jgi:hypothetical protein
MTMKKTILFISLFALFLAACTRPASTESTLKAPQTDTTGLAAFQDWKFQNERAAFDEYQQLKAEAQVQEQAAPVVYKKPAVKRKTTASKPKVVLPDASNEDDGTANNGNSGNTGTTGSEGTNTGQTGTGQEVAKKKTSNAVKGAVIGAGTGAVLGAVINKKNRVLGGVIGGVLGGAVGYGIGKSKDKKEASTNDYSLMTSN